MGGAAIVKRESLRVTLKYIVLGFLQINGLDFTNINIVTLNIKLLFSIRVNCLRNLT